MGTDEKNTIILKFQELKSNLESIYEDDKWWSFDRNFNTFLEKLEGELLPLPDIADKNCEIYAWIAIIAYRIEKMKSKGVSTEIGHFRLAALKKLKTKLTEIRTTLVTEINRIEGKDETEREQSLTLKQQILLLKAIGILDMEDIKSLPLTKQAILISGLLSYSKKTVKDLLTHHDNKQAPPDLFLFKQKNTIRVNELLKNADLQKYTIK